MSSRSPAPGTLAGSTPPPTQGPLASQARPPQRCQLILQRCVAIQLAKPGNAPDDFWMYDSGYLLFQGFLSANSQCWWVSSLGAACRGLRYAGYVAPGLLLLSGDPCALEVIRSAYSRSVLKPPPSYLICGLGDIDDCIVTPAYQGQFTPLPEALCDVIMDITAQGQSATMENIRLQLASKFPSMQSPSADVVYDTLAQLSQQGHLYQTSRGYFIVTPERRRCRRSRSQPSRRPSRPGPEEGEGARSESGGGGLGNGPERAGMLLSAQEALHSLYGEISTIRDGALTHQCIQTNLADVISGGNPNDKILYGRAGKRRSASLPAGRSPDRRSGRSWGGSVRHLPPSCPSTSVTDAAEAVDSSPKKGSLLSRLFRRSGRNKQTRGSIKSFSAQFPPAEWFNSKAVHLHCVATQTISKESLQSLPSYVSSYYDGSEISQRSMTLSRHRRHLSTESNLLPSSNVQYSSSLPRSTLSASFTDKHISEHSPSHRNGNAKVRESPCGSLKRQKYLQSANVISTSGPSSLESNHRGSMKTLKNDSKSGSSSLESQSLANRYPRSQNNSSGHSTLETNYSDRTLQPSPSHSSSQFGTIGLSRAQSLVKVQSLQSSPKSLHKKRKPFGGDEDTAKLSSTASPQASPKTNCSPAKNSPNSSGINSKPEPAKCESSSTAVSANSSSNNSITLKLTTNTTAQNGTGTNTKVYVQNSPARSVITFENGNLTEATKGNNIFIFNDDRYSMTKPSTDDEKIKKNPLNVYMETTLDNFPNQKSENVVPEPYYPNNESVKVQETKFNKNVINDKSMNNNRKLSLQLGNNQSNNGLSYKNQLKNPSETVSSPGTPAIQNNTHSGFDGIENSDPTTPTKSFDNLVDSIGNLRYYEKNNLASVNSQQESQKLNSNGDLKSVELLKKAAAMQTNNRSMYHSRMSSDSIASILSKSSDNKNSVIIGSEPNLVFKNQENQNSPSKEMNSSIEKLNIEDSNRKQKRYSLSQEIKNRNPEFYNFPSLSDLSFNFTSLAAQKILKGVSINSVDTLNELNMAANGTDKQKNCEVTVCTDFGLV